jgi:hypothetical protein
MISVVRLIQWKPGLLAADVSDVTHSLSRAATAPEVAAQLIGRTLPGVRNGGDLIWHLVFEDHAAAARWERSGAWPEAQSMLAQHAAHVESVRFSHGPGGVRRPDLRGGIYRALLFSLEPGTTADQADQLERELLAMPRHIDKILNWRLSRAAPATDTGVWSHVWEQEFAAVTDLTQDYVWHPYHWGVVDRWFDPEMPCRIVSSHLCHTFAPIETSLLGAAPARPAKAPRPG